MTAFVPSSSSIGPTVVFTSVATNDSVTFLQAYTFINTTTNAVNITHSNNTVLNMTTLMSGGSYGIVINSVNDCKVINSATGTIATLSGTIGYNAVYLAGDRNALTNAGNIYSVNGTAVYANGVDLIIDNSGRIHGGDIGIVAAVGDYTIRNSGVIESGTGANSTAVYMAGTGFNKVLINTGVIQSLLPGEGTAVIVEGHNTTTIRNSGTIQSAGGVAIDASTATGGVHLTNSGTISSSTSFVYSVAGTELADIIINTGQINRSVGLGNGDDIFDGIGGFVGGTVFGGDGSDIFRVSDAGATIFEAAGEGLADRVEATVSFALSAFSEVEQLTLLGAAAVGTGNEIANTVTGTHLANTLSGLAGGDTLSGGGGSDGLFGGTEDDSLRGGDDADTLDGGANVDSLFGDAGDDVLRGRSGADSLEGGNDDDRLLGGIAGDRLFGGEGEDTLIGGQGSDTLNGGTESDVFVFITISDSKTGVQRDVIASDFTQGVDMIDLSAIDAKSLTAGDDAFAFIGTTAFTAATPGQLRYQLSGANILVQADVNGDALADFELQINGQAAITAASFVL